MNTPIATEREFVGGPHDGERRIVNGATWFYFPVFVDGRFLPRTAMYRRDGERYVFDGYRELPRCQP